MFRKLFAAAVASLMVFATAPAFASAKSDAVAAVKLALKYANAGDDAKFGAMMLPGGIVIDEFAPFRWSDGLPGWAVAYAAYNTQNGVTQPKTTVVKVKRVLIEGDRAYVSVGVIYSYKEQGKPRKETGIDLFVLAKTAEGWRILSFAWFSKAGVDTGPNADAAAQAVRDELDGFNTGKTDMSKLAWEGVIDEFPAYSFAGVADWGAGFAKEGQTDTHLALGTPDHLSVNGDAAYVAFPALITGKVKGKPIHEKGHFAFVVVKTAEGWKSKSWAWTLD
jgi:ketosteroid isomerase-like protein